MARITFRPLSPEDLDRVSGHRNADIGAPEKRCSSKSGSRRRRATSSPAPPLRTEISPGTPFARLQEGEFGTRDAMAVLDVLGVAPDVQGEGIGEGGHCRSGTADACAGDRDAPDPGRLGKSRDGSASSPPRDSSSRPSRSSSGTPPRCGRRSGRSGARGRMRDRPIRAGGDYYEALSRDRVPVRSLKEGDLAAVGPGSTGSSPAGTAPPTTPPNSGRC